MKNMIKIHIPTEQYGYCEIDCETLEEAKDRYLEAKYIFTEKEGLDDKNWRRVLDRYLSENTMSPDEYDQMSNEQRRTVQEIKRSFARIKNKQDEIR
jgi:hypothetical protein